MRFLALTLLLMTAASAQAEEIVAETEHLRWVWTDDAMDAEDRALVQESGEVTYREVAVKLGIRRDERTVVLMLAAARNRA